ncbi:MAG: hypothetical protein ABR564_09245 [Candidatus Dormibacteria bacterium]
MTAAFIGVGVLLLVALIGVIIHIGMNASNVATPWTERYRSDKGSGKGK